MREEIYLLNINFKFEAAGMYRAHSAKLIHNIRLTKSIKGENIYLLNLWILEEYYLLNVHSCK